MTIGIAYKLPDGALLVADGKQTWPLTDGRPAIDDVDKVRQVGSAVFLIPFGVVQASTLALIDFQQAFDNNLRLRHIESQLEESVRVGWTHLIRNLSPDIDLRHPTMRVALIVGGLIEDVPFVAGSLQSSQSPPSTKSYTGSSVNVMSLGGENQDTPQLLLQMANQIFRKQPWQRGADPINLHVALLLKTAAQVIRLVESQDSTVGGIIRYAVVRRGMPVEKAIWTM